MTDLLTPLGFRVAVAEDGAACLDIAAGRGVDLFLIDLSMPGLSGWELAKALRQMCPVVPIVIVSADGRELKQPPADAPHDDVMTKPVSIPGLLDRIGRLLQLEWDQAEAAPSRPSTDALTTVQVETLREMAAIGYVTGLRTQLDVFERDGAEVAALRALLAEYRLEDFLAALESLQGGPLDAVAR